jgi:hypothetical protein
VTGPAYFVAGDVLFLAFGPYSRTILPGYRLETVSAVDLYCEENTTTPTYYALAGRRAST